QTMPKVRAEWPEATGALGGHTGPMNCETDISHLLRLLTRPLRTLTDRAHCLFYTACYFSLSVKTLENFYRSC
ncbi:Ectonucleotide pyrophosphatase/phosphodiesterase C27A7.3, partial [Clarias magur]